jgi:hypothetical protein
LNIWAVAFSTARSHQENIQYKGLKLATGAMHGSNAQSISFHYEEILINEEILKMQIKLATKAYFLSIPSLELIIDPISIYRHTQRNSDY